MKIQKYNRSIFFYTASILIPWIFWFGAAYLSHKYENQSDAAIGILSILGLIAPFIIALNNDHVANNRDNFC